MALIDVATFVLQMPQRTSLFWYVLPALQKRLQRRLQSDPRQSRPPTSDDMSGPELPDTGGTPADDLYVMCYDNLDCEALKIGRAADVEARARQLEASHNFRMRVLATFAGLGDLESRLHGPRAHSRASERGPFRLTNFSQSFSARNDRRNCHPTNARASPL